MDIYTEEAIKVLKEFFLKNCPQNYLVGSPDDYLQWFDNFSDDGICTVKWDIVFGTNITLAFGLTSEAAISWGGMQRRLVNAVACVNLYKQVVDFAVALEAKRLSEVANIEAQANRKRKK